MIDVNDLRRGVTFELDNQLYEVLEYSHNKPGRGNATIRTKLHNLRSAHQRQAPKRIEVRKTSHINMMWRQNSLRKHGGRCTDSVRELWNKVPKCVRAESLHIKATIAGSRVVKMPYRLTLLHYVC